MIDSKSLQVVLRGAFRGVLRSALGPFNRVIDKKVDTQLRLMGELARQHLESVPMFKRKKALFFLGFHQSKFVALNDATLIMSLQLRGVEVIPVLSGFFYKNEDVIFGGKYNSDRYRLVSRYSYNESYLLNALLRTEPISMAAFADAETELAAHKIAESAQFSDGQDLRFEGIDIGGMASKAVANMNNVPAMQDNADHLDQFRWHVYNVVRLIGATRSIIGSTSPDTILSNIPIYYRWRVPFLIARENKIPFYSYMLGERKNTVAWSSDTDGQFDSSPAWSGFMASGLYEKYKSVVSAGIEDRVGGRVSHIRYLRRANMNQRFVQNVRVRMRGRPAILFPVNVLVDAAALVSTDSFSSCMDMVASVIAFFKFHPEYVCILKAHPAESIWMGSGTDVSCMHLRNALHSSGLKLPENVIFIDYDQEVSSFDLYDMVKGLIAYTSSTCMEIAWLGKPVVTAHRAHYHVAGFAYCPTSAADFIQSLKGMLVGNCSEKEKKIEYLSRVYYLLYYYVCQMDLKLVEGNDIGSIPARLLYHDIGCLQPGSNDGLDYLCDSIINGLPIFSDSRWPPVTV